MELRVPYFPDPDYTFKTVYTKRYKDGTKIWLVQLISNKKHLDKNKQDGMDFKISEIKIKQLWW